MYNDIEHQNETNDMQKIKQVFQKFPSKAHSPHHTHTHNRKEKRD